LGEALIAALIPVVQLPPRSVPPPRPTCAPGAASPGCPRRRRRSARSWSPSAASAAANCSTSPTHRAPTPTPRPRYGSCLRSTTQSWATTTAAGSSTTPPRGLSAAGERAVLVDGRVAATWTVQTGIVTVTPLRRLSRADRTAVAEEGRALSSFLSDGQSHRLQIVAAPR